MKQKNINNKEFKVPKDYFNTIEDSVFEKLSKNNGYSVPKKYFDTVENSVFKQLNLTQQKEIKTISLKQIVIQISIAASFILIFSLTYLNNNTINLTQIASNDIENWLIEDIDSIDLYSYAETYDDVNIDEIQNFNNNDLLNHLEGKNIESILNELEIDF